MFAFSLCCCAICMKPTEVEMDSLAYLDIFQQVLSTIRHLSTMSKWAKIRQFASMHANKEVYWEFRMQAPLSPRCHPNISINVNVHHSGDMAFVCHYFCEHMNFPMFFSFFFSALLLALAGCNKIPQILSASFDANWCRICVVCVCV